MHHASFSRAIGLLAATAALIPSATAAGLPVRIVDWNIRYATSSPGPNEKPWWDLFCSMSKSRCRQPHVIAQLQSMVDGAEGAAPGAASIVALQEALQNQVDDINKGLAGGTGTWSRLGHGRDDGYHKGEYNPIFYRSDQLRLVYEEMKWLSTTPDTPSLSWGAGSRRVVVVGVFEHIATGKRFIHANTHLDNASLQARAEGIKVAVQVVKAVRDKYPGLGVTLTGDFNSAAGAAGDGDGFQTLKGLDFLTEVADSGAQKIGDITTTWTDFDTNGISRIDFVWLGSNKENLTTAQRWEILDNNVDGMKISDHRATYADVTFS
ncbi:endonuclease/exonuclease/phosphatase family protein [Apiospora saccharicola]|uniref:Endonuclease/exonuclease/phosphatase family protein n=1 Tax=Apiospora saccharicola TaxID=335842 RepID=A0ABR1V902_9PEZI